MARGIIRSNNGSTSRSSVHPVNTGTLEDAQSKTVFEFEQPYFDQLGLNIGEKVAYSIVKDSTGKDIAVGLEPIERGVVETVTSDGGTLKEKANGTVIDFAHTRNAEQKITTGSIVKYEKVDFNGKAVATSITLIR